MSSVDDRIVNMQFNNKQFLTGASETQKSLQSLESSLAKTGSNSGLSAMGDQVSGLTGRFSAMEVAGVTAVATIVNKAVNAGLTLAKSLTIDPITQGYQEYITNLNSIQTVMSNTGKSVSVVNDAMNKLNHYSDLTIYNFSEMARNVGTFTAAGVDLKTATSAIQGIANLAALSGSNAQQASTAMYQLSQAIAAGRVGLQDWNSVVNAGMGGKQFQTSLATTAVAMGQLSASAVGIEGHMKRLTINSESFRQSISTAGGAASWLSSDVLVNTLAALDGRFSKVQLALNGYKGAAADAQIQQARLNLEQQNGIKYTDEQFKAIVKQANAAYKAATTVKTLPQLLQVVQESVGSIWSNSFSIILGDFNQSKKLWGSVYKVVAGPKGFVTRMGSAWTSTLREFVSPSQGGVEGGRTKILSGLARTFRNLGKIMHAVREAFHDIFPPATHKQLTNIGKAFNHLSRYFVLSRDTVKDLRSVFAGLFSILHIGFSVLKGVGSFFANILKAIAQNSGDAGGGLLSLVASVAKLITAFDKWVTDGGRISTIMGDAGKAVGEFIAPALQGLGLVIQAVASLASGGTGLSKLSGELHNIFSSFSSLSDLLQRGQGLLAGFFGGGKGGNAAAQVSSTFDRIRASIEKLLPSGDQLSKFFQNIGRNAGSLAGQGISIGADILSGIVKGLASAIPVLMGSIVDIAKGIIQGFKNILGIHSPSTEMIPVGMNIILGIGEGIGKGLVGIVHFIEKAGHFIADAFNQLFGGMDALDISILLNSIFSGAFILAITRLTGLLGGGGGGGLITGLVSFFSQFKDSLKTFQNAIRAEALQAIAVAVALLVGSLLVLTFIDPNDLGKGIGALATLLAMLNASMVVLEKSTKGGKRFVFIATGMVLMGQALILLSGAVAILGHMDLQTLAKGIGSLAIVMGIMVGAMTLLNGIGGKLGTAGAAMILMAVALNILAGAVALFGNMDLGTLAKGFGSIAIGLGLMTASLLVLSAVGKGALQAAASIAIIAGSMVVLSTAVFAFGNMDLKTLAKGFGSVAIGLGLMVAALLIMAPMAPEVIAAAGAMLIMSTAMVQLAIAVGAFGSMDVSTLAKGFAAVAIGLSLLLLAAAGAAYVAPGLIVLAGSILAIGAAMFLAGTGMLLFATGLTILVAAGSAGIAIMVVAFEAFMALLPVFALQMAGAFVIFLETIARAAPRVRAAMDTIFGNLLGVIKDNIPKIGALMQTLILTGISIIRNSASAWAEAGIHIISEFLQAVAREVPKIAEAAAKMVQDFLTTLANHLPGIIDAGTRLIVEFIQGMGEAAVRIAKAAGRTIGSVLEGLDQAIKDNSHRIGELGVQIAVDLLTGIAGGVTDRMGSILGGALGNVGDFLSSHSGGLIGRMSSRVSPQTAVNAALSAANALEAKGDPGILKLAQAADEADRAAVAAAVKAQMLDKVAQDLEAKSQKSPKNAALKKKAKAARQAADDAAAKAQGKANAAQSAHDAIDAAQQYAEADNQQQGDIKTTEANDLADRANKMLRKAQADKAAAEATKDKDLAKKLRKQAADEFKKAAALAQQAQDAAAQARKDYAEAAHERIADLDAEEQARRDQEAYDAADTAGKIAMMKKRADEQEQLAAAMRANAETDLAQARALADSDPVQAMQLLDQAEEYTQQANDAADAAQQAQQTVEQLMNQPGTSDGSVNSASIIQPSRSVLEDAAKAVDRHTASLQEAMDLALATQQVVQFNQNNYSPEALTSSEIYRNTRNLLSAREVAIGAPT